MHTKNYQDRMWALIYDQYNRRRYEKELLFYSSELKDCEGPVLEVACGTGMILLKLLEQGIDVHGFDISEEMLNVLFAKAGIAGITDIHKRVSKQNMRDFNYSQKFDSIIIPARSFLHLTAQEDQIVCLKNIYAHLNPGGRLLLNFFNPDLQHLVSKAQPSDEYESIGSFAHPVTKAPIGLSFKQINDISRQVQNITWRFKTNDSVHEVSMDVRWVYKEEFQLLLRIAGFHKWALYGDFDKREFTGKENELIWIAEK